MPLSCLRAGETLATFHLTDNEWTEIRTTYRNMGLSMRCCSSRAIPKVSRLGTRFFAHQSRAACQSGPESPEHLKAKFLIAESARAAGWDACVEEPGCDPDGNTWIADVLCTRGSAKLAFEVQLAPQSPDQYQARQSRYQRSGVRCLWLTKLRRIGSAIEALPPTKELPHVLLDVKEQPNPIVHVGNSYEASVPLPDFVKGALAGDLFWAETRPGTRVVEIQIASISCWKCDQSIKAVRGYVINNYFVPLAVVSDRDGLAKFISALRQGMPEITPISLKYSGTLQTKYFAAACPFCSALLGDWFMTADFFTEVATCDHPNYSCPDIVYGREIGCHIFDYATLSLRIGSSELSNLPSGEWLWRPLTRGANPPRIQGSDNAR